MRRSLIAVGTAVVLAIVAKITFPAISAYLAPDWTTAISALVAALITAFVASTRDTQTDAVQGMTTLYVGNLPYRANEAAVRKLFAEHGKVFSVRLMKDRQTGKRRGFGFVEMAENDAAQAIAALNDADFQQRNLKVREAKNKTEQE
ncbi:RNA-binding protein [Neiella marina]|uniref:RNA-binding protein n=2 Tax=Neiella holothuriorum TaxID=2870530 RepID=A0ABS7EG34_9GAMM|nr:RNA-binding protein [Neiella holothuriorum]